MANAQNLYMYIGTYAHKDEPGIYIYTLDADSGALTFVDRISGIENPSYMAIDESKRYLYTVSETNTYEGQDGGSVAAYSIHPQTGKLTWLNQQPTLGAAPCYASIDQASSSLLVVNYFGGSLSVYPLQSNGEIGPMSDHIQHEGKGIRPDRQDGPHPHSIPLGPRGLYAFVPDLGLDRIFAYQLDGSEHRLTLRYENVVTPGSGPRHMAWHPSLRYAYVINELASTIIAFSIADDQYILHPIQTVSAIPDDFKGQNTSAEVSISDDGRFLYASNRGDDSIVVFSVDPESGKLTFVQRVSSGGKTPRYFTLAPGGRFLFAANQDSASVVTYTVDQETGRLEQVGVPLQISRPVCIKIV